MRTGKNPSKTGVPAYSPKQLGMALLVYIPFMKGYFRQSLDILKYQIASIHHHTNQEIDLLLFDNGSCSEVVDELIKLYNAQKIDWLVFSQHNLGKVGAWNWIFGSMPNQLICYADSDVFFRQGWLNSSLEIIQAFPNIGMVSAQPTFHDVLDGRGKAHLSLEGDQNFRFGEYRPNREIVDEYCQGIGADDELSASFHDMDLPYITDLRSNTNAVVGATHMQFIIPREVARQVIPLPVSKALHRSETTTLDRKIDDLGYLHLSTQKNYVMHMGNTINEKLLSEMRDMDESLKHVETPEELILSKRSVMFRLAFRLGRKPSINNFFLRIYDFLYRVLYVENQ